MSSKETFIKLLRNPEKIPIKIVFLCSGNVIRSVFAEYLTKRCLELVGNKNLIIESGACFHQNSSILSFTRKWLRKEGFSNIVISSHNPRLITNFLDEFNDTMVFIGMTLDHIDHVKKKFPNTKAFLLKQVVVGKDEEVLDPYFNSEMEDEIMQELTELIYQFCKILNENLS